MVRETVKALKRDISEGEARCNVKFTRGQFPQIVLLDCVRE
jgi:hypothetical protein